MQISNARAANLGLKADRDPFTHFVFATPDNLFDPKVMFYPTANTIAVDIDGVPAFFGPFHAVVMLESLAFRPEMSDRERAIVLRRFHDGIENACTNLKIREIFFVCADDRVAEFALGRGYTEINGEMVKWALEHGYDGPVRRVLKMKLKGPEDSLAEEQLTPSAFHE